jgi:hypothetical protein
MSFLSGRCSRYLKLELGTLMSFDGKRLKGSATKQEQQTPKAQGGRSAVHVLEGLRANHPTFLGEATAAFEAAAASCEATRFDEDFDLGHGRIECRATRVLSAEALCAERLADWAGLKSLVAVESERFFLNSDKVERETRYYISSLDADAKTQQAYIRRHWGIENRLPSD